MMVPQLPASVHLSCTFHSPSNRYRKSIVVRSALIPHFPSSLQTHWKNPEVSKLHFKSTDTDTRPPIRVVASLSLAWRSIPLMWRVVAIGCGAFGAFVASKKAWGKLQEKQGDSPMHIIAKGASCLQSNVGPWSLRDLTLGLAGMAKVAEKEPPPPPGQAIHELSKKPEFLACAQHWRAMAEAVYVCDSASFSLQSQLPESALVHAEWNPDESSLRPAYAVCIDGAYGAVVLSIRGTSHVIDMLVNSGASPEPFCGGQAHGGFVHATEVMLKEIQPHLEEAFSKASKEEKDRGRETKLVIVGHSMGAAVGIMCGLKLRDQYPDLECWGYSPPASLSLNLAQECAKFATCFISAHDVVPRFSMASVERLRQRVMNFDWEHAKGILEGDPEWKNIERALKTMTVFQEKVGEKMDGLKEAVGTAQNKGKEAMQGGDECKGKRREDRNEARSSSEISRSEEDENGVKSQQPSSEEDEKSIQNQEPPALYPPGRLLVLVCDPPGCGKKPCSRSNVPQQRNFGAYPSFEESEKIKWVLHEAKQEEFVEILVSPWCISDHMLGNLCEGLGFLQRHSPPTSLSPSSS